MPDHLDDPKKARWENASLKLRDAASLGQFRVWARSFKTDQVSGSVKQHPCGKSTGVIGKRTSSRRSRVLAARLRTATRTEILSGEQVAPPNQPATATPLGAKTRRLCVGLLAVTILRLKPPTSVNPRPQSLK
jgi:hypothetical protein